MVVAALSILRRAHDPQLTLTVVEREDWPLSGPEPDGVTVLGPPPQGEVARIYDEHDLFVMPSRQERSESSSRKHSPGPAVRSTQRVCYSGDRNPRCLRRRSTGDAQAIVAVLEDGEIYRLCTARAADIAAYFSWERTSQDIADLVGRGLANVREMELDRIVRVFVTRPGELGPAEIDAWHSMQRATPALANPFLTPEFAVAVGRLRPSARVAVLTEGGSITGFFPFEKRRLSAGVPVCGWLTPCQGLIHAPGLEWDPQELLRGCQLSAWRFDNLIADQRPFKPFHAATVASPRIDLSDGFGSYYAKLRVKSSRFCRELDRKSRKLTRELGDLRIVADSRDTSVLHTLMAWKSSQYRQTHHVDRFEQAWLVELLETLLATRSPQVSGMLSVLYAGDQPVAAQFGMRTETLLVGWFTGYEEALCKYSPGLIHLLQMTEKLPETGIRVIDMGGGAKSYYKETLKSDDSFVAQGVVTDRSVLGAAHCARSALTWSARRAVRQSPGLHWAADQILRRSGVADRIYGRI